jgi:hypothetical protein
MRCSMFSLLAIGLAPMFAMAQEQDKGISEWGWGLGIGIEQYRQQPYIEQAGTYGTDRIVVIEKEYRTNPSAWMTLNWNVWPRPKSPDELKAAGLASDVQKVKYGFFAGVKLLDANAQALSAFSLGPQVSFFTADRQVSVGFGWVNHRTKRFAAGIQEGEPLPAQYTDIKFRESSENSYMVMFSVSL